MPTWTRAALLLAVLWDFYWEVMELRKGLRQHNLENLVEAIETNHVLNADLQLFCAKLGVGIAFVFGIIPHLTAAAFLFTLE